MSLVIDADFTAEERARLLDEVREHLPAFLHRGATEQHDPVGDVRALLNLEDKDLTRVIAVHQCLDESVLSFGDGLADGLRRPVMSSVRPAQTGQAVRGPIDWAATISRRALGAGNGPMYVVRAAQRIFDIEENRALAWLLERLESSASFVLPASSRGRGAKSGTEALGWWQRIERLQLQLRGARQVQWLRHVRPEAPRPATLKRLRAARSAFYAETLVQAIESVIRLTAPDEETLTDVLAKRYFRPEETWRLFELVVSLRLARALAEASPAPRKSRLLVGAGSVPFARYGFADGSEVALVYQGWPDDGTASLRRRAGDWHDLGRSSSRPDLFVARTGPVPDAAVLEVKATFSSGYLGSGLSQLLGYLGERPDLWRGRPAGWLVAPASAAFVDRAPSDGGELWVVSADRIAAAVLERFVAA